jgi:purine-binding chemotaxis protein CheW
VTLHKTQASGGRNLVGFELGGVCYAIEIQRVREIVRPLPTLPLPHVPVAVLGVVDHRGDVVPIIDLRTCFAVKQGGRDKDVRFIIATRGERLVGLVVDKVSEVFGTLDSASRELPQIGTGEEARAIKAVYSHRNRLVFVLDIDRLTAIADEIEPPAGGPAERGALASG